MVTHVNNPARPLSQRLAQALDGYPLQTDQHTGATLMCMPDVEEHTEHYLSIEHGDSVHRGMLTGVLGGTYRCDRVCGLAFPLGGSPPHALAHIVHSPYPRVVLRAGRQAIP